MISKTRNYDLHLVIVFMSLATAMICSFGVGSALLAEAGGVSLDMLLIRPDTLGDYMNSPLAVVFNLSLLAGGSCFLLAMVAVFNTYQDGLSRYLAMVGCVVGISIILMGVFPINFLDTHRNVSTLYLVSSIVLHCVCVLDYFKPGSTMNKRMLLLTIIALISGTILIVLLDWHQLDFPPCSNYLPQFCVVSLAMWSLTQANILWCVCLSFSMMKTIKVQQKVAYKWLENY
ncbi:DUF998 domain-containing protein [Shewanella litoralis]|uniref:DUF998 domain-containing protein n=1 Tax=Shewanella litoralis TaxID=2282700 RepID=A0ABQ2REX0_9GAMM|nr:DUF998 domain-containing protein [Shewanella litoralis]GGQ24253.1 hypothetical protein GCM10009411_25340 [Shewanella litoralis]